MLELLILLNMLLLQEAAEAEEVVMAAVAAAVLGVIGHLFLENLLVEGRLLNQHYNLVLVLDTQ